MWKSFIQSEGEPAVYLKVETFDNKTIKTEAPEDRLRYNISVTNFIKIWNGIYDNKGIITMMLVWYDGTEESICAGLSHTFVLDWKASNFNKRLLKDSSYISSYKESNKGTEAVDEQGFLNAGLRMLNNPKQVDKKVFYETQQGNLCVRLLRKAPFVLKMNFTLVLCTAENFYQSVTRPLLAVINEKMSSERKLRHQLIKKDQEIKGFLDMLPEGSPLMRCLRTEEYNDQEHMETHGALEKLFGTDSDEKICPSHILLYGRPLPVLPADDTQIKNETSTHPGPTTDADPSTLLIPVKTEPNIDTSGPKGTNGINKSTIGTDKGTSGPDRGTNGPARGTNGPDRGTLGPDRCTIGPDRGTNGPDKGTFEPNVIKSEPDDHNRLQTDGASIKIETFTQSQSAPNQTKPVLEDLDRITIKSEHDSNTQDEGRRRSSPEAKPDVNRLQSTTPKKRRRNLNY